MQDGAAKPHLDRRHGDRDRIVSRWLVIKEMTSAACETIDFKCHRLVRFSDHDQELVPSTKFVL